VLTMNREVISSVRAKGSRVSKPVRPEPGVPPSTLVRSECAAPFGEIYQRNRDTIFRLALRITHNRQDAEDVVHDSFIHAFVHFDSFLGKSKLSTWISRIAINTALMKVRARRQREFSIDDPVEHASTAFPVEIRCDGPMPDQEYFQLERVQTLADGLAQLSPGLQSAVNLYYFAELSVPECAQVLGVSVSTAKARIFRAKLKLRESFRKHFWRGITSLRSGSDQKLSVGHLGTRLSACPGSPRLRRGAKGRATHVRANQAARP